jgi:hypothetical protein
MNRVNQIEPGGKNQITKIERGTKKTKSLESRAEPEISALFAWELESEIAEVKSVGHGIEKISRISRDNKTRANNPGETRGSY